MGFIKHALVGIALYEAVKYCLGKQDRETDVVAEGPQGGAVDQQQLRSMDIDIIAGARQPDHLESMKENTVGSSNVSAGLASQDLGDNLVAGTDPETPLTGEGPRKDANDPWKASLANDELRAPDS